MTAKEKEKQGINKYAPVKAVVRLDDSVKVMERYSSVKEAAEKNGLRPQEICNAIRRNGRAKGLRFGYAEGQERQAVDIGKMIVGNCDGCKNNNTEECMHCMRAYSDCYESEG